MSVKGSRGKTEIKQISHKELCRIAAIWLQNYWGCNVVARELGTSAGEIPDAFGVKHGICYLIECNATRSDFLADGKKIFRIDPALGIGSYRYFICPAGLIQPEEVPENWGLLWKHDFQTRVVKEPECQESNAISEKILLTSIIRRLEISSCVFVSPETPPEKLECFSTETYDYEIKAIGNSAEITQ
jgi:hypothetical protein